jgi:glutamate-1-semialdehyde 2,1-aminomutase
LSSRPCYCCRCCCSRHNAPGVPASTAAATLTATYNDLESVKALFAANKGEVAGVILEPVVGNSGFIVPSKEFLQVCRLLALCLLQR